MPENYESEQARNNAVINGDEIDMVDLVAILYRRCWLMVGVFVFIVGLAVAYCFIATPKYEIIAQIKPGATGFDKDNLPLYDYSAQDIQTWFQRGGYVDILAKEYGDEFKVPEIEASSGKDINMLTLSFYWPSADEGKKILSTLIGSFRNSETMAQNYSVEIEQEVNKTQVFKTELNSIKTNIDQTQKAIGNIKAEIEEINRNTKELMKLRQEMINTDTDKLSLLMYSNIIHQNIIYVANLERRVSDLEKEQNNFVVLEAESNEKLKNNQIRIKDLMTKRDKELTLKKVELDSDKSIAKNKLYVTFPVEVVQNPYNSMKPVKPKKLKIFSLSVGLACFLSIIVVFLREFWIKNKGKLTS